jgi:hypothetical protein
MPILGITASNNQAIKANSFYQIATTTLSTGNTTVTFDNIPQTYKHLQIRWSARQTTATSAMIIRFNNISTTSYRWHALSANGTSVTSTNSGATALNGIRIVNVGGVSATANFFNSGIIDIYNYSDSTNYNKLTKSFSGIDLNGSGHIALESGLFYPGNTDAITRLDFITTNQMQSGTIFSLYGIEGDYK